MQDFRILGLGFGFRVGMSLMKPRTQDLKLGDEVLHFLETESQPACGL